MTEVFKVSQSKIKTWRRCRQQYHYRYVEGLRRRLVKRSFGFGRIFHRIKEAYAEGEDIEAVTQELLSKQGKRFAEELEGAEELAKDALIIMKDYDKYWGENSLKYVRLNGSYTEHEFELPLSSEIVATGVIDAIARTGDRKRWLVENKSFAKLPDEEARWRNIQSVWYIWAIDELGLKPVDGTCWNYVWSHPPGIPQELKKGGWSKQACVTLPTKLEQYSEEHGVTFPKDVWTAAAEYRQKYFQRYFNPRDDDVIQAVLQDVRSTAQEIVDFGGLRREKSIEFHCNQCDYKDLCRAELTKGDVDAIKEADFTTRESRARLPSGDEKVRSPLRPKQYGEDDAGGDLAKARPASGRKGRGNGQRRRR